MVLRVIGKDGARCTCDECGKLFYRRKSRVGEYNQFCSPYCHIVWEGRQWEWNNATFIRKIKVFQRLTG